MQSEIYISLFCLQSEKILLYPTDTVWGIGCDATNEHAVSKIYRLKRKDETKSLLVLMSSIEMLKSYIPDVPQKAIELIALEKKPITIIYQNPIGLANNVIAKDKTVAIRVTNNLFCKQLIEKFKKPIISTSANMSNDPTPKSFKEINKSILEKVDYVVNLQQKKQSNQPSTIIKISDNGDLDTLRA